MEVPLVFYGLWSRVLMIPAILSNTKLSFWRRYAAKEAKFFICKDWQRAMSFS